MEFFLFLFLIVLIFFLWPLVKAALFYRRIKKNINKAWKNAARNQAQQAQATNHASKIFDRNVGEYVKFEEISVEASTYRETVSDTLHEVVQESQTIDIEWEDI